MQQSNLLADNPALEEQSEESRLRKLNPFWRIVVAVSIGLALLLTINSVFALRLLGPLNWDSAYLYCLFATILSLGVHLLTRPLRSHQDPAFPGMM